MAGAAAAADGALPAEEYLERHDVRTYLHDALALLLVHRPDKPLEFLAEYYRRARRGENVRNREFKYVNSTPRNRLAYLALFRRTYAKLAERSDLTFLDYLELQRVLCPDFSSQFCEDVRPPPPPPEHAPLPPLPRASASPSACVGAGGEVPDDDGQPRQHAGLLGVLLDVPAALLLQ